MIEIKDIYKNFGRKKVLNGVSFTVEKGEITCLVGVNGVGKTMLPGMDHAYSHVTGLKTGTTAYAGSCFVAVAEENGTDLISVILGASTNDARFIETAKLLGYGFDHDPKDIIAYQRSSSVTSSLFSSAHLKRIYQNMTEDLVMLVPFTPTIQ